jgi:hypothetical protein
VGGGYLGAGEGREGGGSGGPGEEAGAEGEEGGGMALVMDGLETCRVVRGSLQGGSKSKMPAPTCLSLAPPAARPHPPLF